MTRRVVAPVALALLLGPARADEAHTIRLKPVEAGDTLRVTKRDGEKSLTRIVDAAGKAHERQRERTVTTVYVETVLEKPADRSKPTRLRRQYEKAEEKAGDKTAALSLQGKTILIEKKEGTYQFHVEGGTALKGEDASRLDDEFNRGDDQFDFDRAVLPRKAVQVGESWKIDAGPIARDLVGRGGFDVDPARSEGTGKLVKVYRRDGRRFGVLEVHLAFPVRALQGDKEKIPVEAGAVLKIQATMDVCVDGTAQAGVTRTTSQVDLKGQLAAPDGSKLSLVIRSQGEAEEKVEALPRK